MVIGSKRLLLFQIAHILTHLVHLIFVRPEFIDEYCNYDYGVNYTANSSFARNLDTVSSALSSGANFQSFTADENPDDPVNVIALCRGDLAADTCRSCLADSYTELRRKCVWERQAIGWRDDCMLRYSDETIYQTMATVPNAERYNDTHNVSSVDWFSNVLEPLLNELREQAANGDSVRKFAARSTTGGQGDLGLYLLVQCTPDLEMQRCRDCLNFAVGEYRDRGLGMSFGGRILTPSCNFRYENGEGSFFDEAAASAPYAPPLDGAPPPPDGSGGNNNIVIIIVVTTATFAILVVSIFIFIRRKRNSGKASKLPDVETLRYNFNTIRVATNYFSDKNKLGVGGFGAVYKGRLQNSQDIAVKRLSENSKQGELEFENEVLLLAKLQHRNLVRLLGFCHQKIERLLIYEFVPNSSLDRFIFDPVKRATLHWDTRYKIIGGVARGLLYLHEDSRLRIIHRDLKPSNVLLDAEMNPKIADFGLAKLFEVDQTHGNTSRIAGSYGYMAPEYLRGQLSLKSDVYSFGVVLLEIISGQKNTNFQKDDEESVMGLLSYAWKNWREGTTSNLIDPAMRAGSDPLLYITRCIHIGLLCVQEKPADRPTMGSVINMLNTVSLTLPPPLEPGLQRTTSVKLSINEASITELSGR